MSAHTDRTRGRAAPPPAPAPGQPLFTTPLPPIDVVFADLGLVELRFTPSLSWRAFRRFAARYGLVHTPQPGEPQIFLSPARIEVAYGMLSVTPLPRQVPELWLVGGEGTTLDQMLTLIAAMLDAWPHASWSPSDHDNFTPILRKIFPHREGGPRR